MTESAPLNAAATIGKTVDSLWAILAIFALGLRATSVSRWNNQVDKPTKKRRRRPSTTTRRCSSAIVVHDDDSYAFRPQIKVECITAQIGPNIANERFGRISWISTPVFCQTRIPCDVLCVASQQIHKKKQQRRKRNTFRRPVRTRMCKAELLSGRNAK